MSFVGRVLVVATLMLLGANQAMPQAYVVGRYTCIDNSDNSDRGDCDVTVQGRSCPQACSSARTDLQSRGGDPCRVCVQNEIDNTRHWNGSVQWVQDGTCSGFSCW